eukprot:6207105-Pleurochrysis_carterae.AAC.7
MASPVSSACAFAKFAAGDVKTGASSRLWSAFNSASAACADHPSPMTTRSQRGGDVHCPACASSTRCLPDS